MKQALRVARIERATPGSRSKRPGAAGAIEHRAEMLRFAITTLVACSSGAHSATNSRQRRGGCLRLRPRRCHQRFRRVRSFRARWTKSSNSSRADGLSRPSRGGAPATAMTAIRTDMRSSCVIQTARSTSAPFVDLQRDGASARAPRVSGSTQRDRRLPLRRRSCRDAPCAPQPAVAAGARPRCPRSVLGAPAGRRRRCRRRR